MTHSNTFSNSFISCKESRIENNRSFYGCFYLGPFDSSQSLTVGNALRRVLLSECSGLGIVSVTIDNVTHEYSTIPGMRESVLDLILNLKEIVLKKRSNTYSSYKKNSTIYNQIGNSYFKPVAGFLKVKGPGVIRAKDLKLPPFLECVDPEQYIATLAEDGSLCMKFIIMEGKGYLLQNQKRDLFSGLGEISNEQDTKPTASFIHSNVVKNRLNFLNQMKNYVSANHFGSGTLRTPISAKNSKYSQGNISLFEDKKISSTSSTNIKSLAKENKGQLNTNTPLNIDTVFNPITKVSYMIEDFDNKIVDDSNLKVNFVDDISTLIESSAYLKQNLPFLTEQIDFNQADISNFVDIYSTSEIQKISGSLHPLKKQNPLHTIVLEIWTNGSLHPREALYLALDKLASAFLNLKKTVPYNSIYVNESSLLMAAQKSLVIKDLPLLFPTSENENKDVKDIKTLTLTQSSTQPPKVTLTSNSSNTVEKLYSKEDTTYFNPQTTLSGSFQGKKDQGIEFLNISLRPYTLLKRSNINTISDLCQLTIDDLKYICGFNNKYVANILESLAVVNQTPLSFGQPKSVSPRND